MKTQHLPWLVALVINGVSLGLLASSSSPAWDQIKASFVPSPEFKADLGTYRSPLLFNDGRMVRTKADWNLRRKEILDYWHKIMGPWPPLLERPQAVRLHSEARDNFTQYRVKIEIAAGQTGEGWLLIPQGKGPFPAVLIPFYEPETAIGLGPKPLRDFAYQLTRRGFVTLAIGAPGSAWEPDTGTAICQPLSFLGYVAANCHTILAQTPEVDPQRIGVMGHSFGGKWAMFGACLHDKFACGVWSDPGIVFDEKRPMVNYWDVWYLGRDPKIKRKRGTPTADNPRTGAYKVLMQDQRDLHEILALMAPRPFLVSGGSEDRFERWRALNHVVAVNRLLGSENRVAMTSRPAHDPTPESNEQIYLFFEHFLKNQENK